MTMLGQAGWNATANATNATATATRAAGTGKTHAVFSVAGSFATAPGAAAALQVFDGATPIFTVDITAAGPFRFEFPRGLAGTLGNAMSASLAAGGAANVGKVNLHGVTTP